MLVPRRTALLLFATLVIGIAVGGLAGVYADQARPDIIPLIAVHGTQGRIDERALDQALQLIQRDYYNSKIDYGKLSDATIQGMVSGLKDPYTYYESPADYKAAQASESGQYTGIGIYVDFRGTYPTVSGLIPDAPAEKVGMKPGDQLESVDGHDLKGLTADQSSARIKGPVGSVARIVVLRGTRTLSFDVPREQISAPFVLWRKLPGTSILYVKIFSFGDKSADQLTAALKSGLRGSKGVILDLRANPGGFLDSARTVISDFVANGEAFEVHDRAGHVEREDVSGDHPAASVPVVVLVDNNSASASEIVAGSLRVNRHIKLVGQKTFGKGSVQQDFPLSNGGDLHLTIKHWFLPDGSSVEGKGLTPDQAVVLADPGDAYDVTNEEAGAQGYAKDTQLVAALKLLGS